jgi:hypothetical protein
MAKRYPRWTDLKPAAEATVLQAVFRKIQQAEALLPTIRAADWNGSVSIQDLARLVADLGVLIREIRNKLHKLAAFRAWWKESKPQSQLVVLKDWDRRMVGLVIDACNEENHHSGPELHITSAVGATYRHEFVTASGPEPVYPACDRAVGLMKEGYRVAAGLPAR